jgi:hypothetical protein
MLRRIIGAARLDIHTYEEVEADKSANLQAFAVVALASLAGGIGLLNTDASSGLGGLLYGFVFAIIGWGVFALIICIIGTTILRTPQTDANWGQLLRTLGFAQSPALLRVFGIIPIIGPIILLLTSIWQIVTTVVAVRQALDYNSTRRAIVVVLIGLIPYVLVMSLLLTLI